MQPDKSETLLSKLFPVIGLCISITVTLFVAEIAFRGYVRLTLEDRFAAPNTSANEIDSPSFSVMSSPGIWIFNQHYGWDYSTKESVSLEIKGGLFTQCGVSSRFNSRGNIANREDDLKSADLIVNMHGSSYTMGPMSDGRLISEYIADIVSENLGKKVVIENLARDSYGVIQMTDQVVHAANAYNPDYSLIAFNSATIAMPRHWRTVKPSHDGFYRFYMINQPNTDATSAKNSYLHDYVLHKDLTVQKCAELEILKKRVGKFSYLNDAFLTKIVEEYKTLQVTRNSPIPIVNFYRPDVSMLWNRIVDQNPFSNMDVYTQGNNPIQPITIDSYQDDEKFRQSMAAIKASGIPFRYMHIPSYPEVLSGAEWEAAGTVGVPAARELSLIKSLEQATGRNVASILAAISAPRSDAAELAQKATPPGQDWHPSEKGRRLFAHAIVDFLTEELRQLSK